jgi:hypothetical protein
MRFFLFLFLTAIGILIPFLSKAQGIADYGGYYVYDSTAHRYVALFPDHASRALVLKKRNDSLALVRLWSSYEHDSVDVWMHNLPDSLSHRGCRLIVRTGYPRDTQPKGEDTKHPHLWCIEAKREDH